MYNICFMLPLFHGQVIPSQIFPFYGQIIPQF